jgi:RNA polymerase sigma factor (sigma-70 family)
MPAEERPESPDLCARVEQAYKENVATLLHLAFGILHNEADAADAVQKGCLDLLRDMPLPEDVTIAAGLIVRVRRAALNESTANRRRRIHESQVGNTVQGNSLLPSDSLARAEERQRIQRVRSSLPDVQKALINLHYDEGYTFSEISAIMQMRPGEVRYQHEQAMKRFREITSDLDLGQNTKEGV